MAQTIEEQIETIERALGERMIEHALVIVRSWLTEIGINNPYEEAYNSIRKRNEALFDAWLCSDNSDFDERLDELTGEMYQLVDAVYADIRLKRGLSPNMHGFNPKNTQSVLNYFQSNVRLRPEDLEWFHDVIQDMAQQDIGLYAVSGLGQNVREYFSADGFMAMIDGINANNKMIADQCLAHSMILFLIYDVRIDYFPHLQDAFVQALEELGDEGEHAFEGLCGLIKATRSQTGLEFLDAHIPVLPQTWLYSILVEGHEDRASRLIANAVYAGYTQMMWDDPEAAESVFRGQLRKKKGSATDYINYAHCLLLRGDRVMAFENYHKARNLCRSPKDFFNLFRPDRRLLVEHGVPIEQVYMIEDQLLNN